MLLISDDSCAAFPVLACGRIAPFPWQRAGLSALGMGQRAYTGINGPAEQDQHSNG